MNDSPSVTSMTFDDCFIDCGYYPEVSVRDSRTLQIRRPLLSAEDSPDVLLSSHHTVCFSEDDLIWLSPGGSGGDILALSLETGSIMQRCSASTVYSIGRIPPTDLFSAARVVSAGVDTVVRFWTHESPNELNAIHTPNSLECVKFLPLRQSPSVIVGGWKTIDYDPRIYDVERGVETHQLLGHRNIVYGLEHHCDVPEVIFSGGYDKKVFVWDIRTGDKKVQPVHTLGGFTGETMFLRRIQGSLPHYLLVFHRATISVMDIRMVSSGKNPRRIRSFCPHPAGHGVRGHFAAMCQVGPELFVSGNESSSYDIALWDLQGRTLNRVGQTKTTCVTSFQYDRAPERDWLDVRRILEQFDERNGFLMQIAEENTFVGIFSVRVLIEGQSWRIPTLFVRGAEKLS